MANLLRDRKELIDLRELQRMKCLSAEQAQSRAFEHLTSQKSARDLAKTELSITISEWDDFWNGELKDPEWLNVLRRAISEKQDQLTMSETSVRLAKAELDASIEHNSQQQDCEANLSKRLRRTTRSILNQRDEVLRESIPLMWRVQT